MALTTRPEPVPIEADTDGVERVGGTRVSLESVVGAFEEGASPEEIVERYPSLSLTDVYLVIGYYLRHHREVGDYLRDREEAERLSRERFPPEAGIRGRLLRRLEGPEVL